jgi:hypothetical protein
MTSPWRTTEWAARYLSFTSNGGPDGVPDLKRLHAWLDKWVPEHQKRYVGRSLRIHIDAIEPNPNLQRAAR